MGSIYTTKKHYTKTKKIRNNNTTCSILEWNIIRVECYLPRLYLSVVEWRGWWPCRLPCISWFLKVFWYVNQSCKFGLRNTPSAVRTIFESQYLTICFEILYETSQSYSMKLRMHVGKFSWFLKMFWHVNQRCKVS